jgi:hypothetical protein
VTKKSGKSKLSDVPGIGPKTEQKLRDAGIKTVSSLAKYEPSKLAKKVDGLGTTTAKKLVASAKRLAPPKKEPKVSKKKTAPQDQMIQDYLLELQSADQQVALGAVDGLANINHPQATTYLIDCLNDPRYMIRLQAALKLGERGDKSAVDILIAALRNDSLFVRQTAAGALESIGGKKAAKAIKEAEADGLLLSELNDGRKL